jgi:hypothetical protein
VNNITDGGYKDKVREIPIETGKRTCLKGEKCNIVQPG